MKENAKKAAALKKRVSKVHSKAQAVGIFYLIGTLLLAVVSFFPILNGTSVGDMSVVNFWRAFPELANIKTSAIAVLLNAGVAALYALLLLTVVINVLRSLSKLSRLFKKKASRLNGFNRNAMAMEEMGKIYSGTYCVFIVFPFMIHLIAGAGFSNLYYIAIAVGLVLHFWLGLVGGNVSLFTTEGEIEEEKRTLGRIAPFFRNLAQIVFVGLIMYFISETNLMLNALEWLKSNDLGAMFTSGEINLFRYGGIPFLQLLCCIWTLVLLKHATATTEYHRDGQEAPGMKNFRVFSILLLITSGVLFGLMFVAHSKAAEIVPTMGTLYIAVVAFAAIIEEFCMCRLPNVKGKVVEEPSEQAAEASDEYDEDETSASEQAPAEQPPAACISDSSAVRHAAGRVHAAQRSAHHDHAHDRRASARSGPGTRRRSPAHVRLSEPLHESLRLRTVLGERQAVQSLPVRAGARCGRTRKGRSKRRNRFGRTRKEARYQGAQSQSRRG